MTYPQSAGGVELKFEFPVNTSPTGVELVFGATLVPAEPQDFIPSAGVTHTAFGDHLVRDPRVLAAGFDAAELGTASVELATPNVYPEGFDSLEFGGAYIADKPAPTQVSLNSDEPGVDGVDGFALGDSFVSHFLRFVEVEYSPQEEWGTAFIGDRQRYMYAGGVPGGEYGDTEATFPKRLLPSGRDLAEYGDAEADFLNVAFPAGLVGASLGQPWAAFRTRHITPFAQQYIEWGSGKIELWQRYLLVNHPPESNATGEKYGQYTEVLNRNRTIGPVGLLAQQTSTSPAYLELTGRAVYPPGIDGAFGGGTFASYRVRSTWVPGYELDRYPNDTTVYNYAATIRANSLSSFADGTPFVEKLLKFVTVSGYRVDGYGTQWASPSPRSAHPVGSDLEGRNNAHYVSHSPYLVQAAGPDGLRAGAPFVYIRPPVTVYASWGQLWAQDSKQMGVPNALRYPPLIEVPGRPYTEFSYPAARVDFLVRSVQPPSATGQEKYGDNAVRDRRFTVGVAGGRTTEYGAFSVENALHVTLPTTQLIGGDQLTLVDAYGSPTVEQRWLDVESAGTATQYGEPECQGNTITFEARHHPSVSTGMLRFGLTRIPGEQFAREVGKVPAALYGHPGTSPFHVYCTPDYPPRYGENLIQGSQSWDDDTADLVARYGTVSVLSARTLYVTVVVKDDDTHKPAYGAATLYRGTQEVLPPGIATFRSGAAQMWPHPQGVGARGLLSTAFGLTLVPPGVAPPFLYPGPYDAFASGAVRVTNLHQEAHQEGVDHATFADSSGYPVVGDWLRVFPSYEASEYGTATSVTNYIRYVSPGPYDGEWGNTRMVRAIQTVFLKGDDQGGFGELDNTRETTIRPYSAQFLCPTSPYTQVLHA